MTPILLASDSAIISAGLNSLITSFDSFQVTCQVTNGFSAGLALERLSIGIAIIDLGMRGENALLTIGRLHRQYPQINIIALSSPAASHPNQALQQGARGFILTDSPASEIHWVLDQVNQGSIGLDRNLSWEIDTSTTKSLPLASRYSRLSSREQEVLPLIILGYSNRQIADRLFISVKTVEHHKSNIMRKLGVNEHAQLVSYAVKHHLVSLS